MTEAIYRRAFLVAQINAAELCELVMRPEAPTVREIATAIGLASNAHEALLRAVVARENADHPAR